MKREKVTRIVAFVLAILMVIGIIPSVIGMFM